MIFTVLLAAMLLIVIVYVVKFKDDFNDDSINKIIMVLFVLGLVVCGFSSCG